MFCNYHLELKKKLIEEEFRDFINKIKENEKKD